MARFTATAAVLFCLFALSLAHTQPNSDDVAASVSLPLSEDTTNPSESVNSDTKSKPLTIVKPLISSRFNPINRRFRVRSKYPCRHRHHLKADSAPVERISYGNDMLVATGENSDSGDPEIVTGGKRQWARLHRRHHHHHHHDEDSDSDDEDDGKVERNVLKRHRYHDQVKRLGSDPWNWEPIDILPVSKHFHHHHHHHHHEEEKKGGFMKRVRDFVDNYL